MHNSTRPAVESLAIVKGHYECRSLDESLPVLSDLLALEIVERRQKKAVLKHPNTEWLLVVHKTGPAAEDKPFRNHYGVRVTDNAEVDRAYAYLMARKNALDLKKVVMRNERAGSYSVFFVEPGGNYWEIESYQHRREAGLPYEISYPWEKPLSEEQFPGRGYIPQAFTHGTIECNDWQSSAKFYTEGLGLEMTTHVPRPKPHNIKHPSKPWYVVSLEVPERSRKYLGPLQRFTLAVASPAKLAEALANLAARREELAIRELGEIETRVTGQSFLICDLDRNWWEIESAGKAGIGVMDAWGDVSIPHRSIPLRRQALQYLNCALCFIVLLLGWSAAEAGAPEAEQKKIEALISRVSDLKDARFVRNGKEYDVTTAVRFLRGKWKANDRAVQSARDFVDRVASASGTSGKFYRIRFKDGRETTSREFLLEELKKLEG